MESRTISHSIHHPQTNGYVCFYKGKKLDVYADTQLAARDRAAQIFKAKNAWEVTAVLAEKNGKQVTHQTSSL